MNSIFSYFNLGNEVEDFEKIHATIEKDLVFKGTNLWILVFAIMVASVGLNMNSTAVIIGAMLISPLMGPINGIGYGIATYNFPLFRRALKNLGFAVGVSLLTSTLYFTLSPVSSADTEILARTSPTIYDVLIALFGGMAGILAIGSKQKGNVIPGVAIATALMPPLCTAGYGLATAQLVFFAGAFYLFLINTVFIAISSVIISRILKFPHFNIMDEKRKKRVHRLVSLVIFLTVVPSIYLGYDLVRNERFVEKAGQFVKTMSSFQGSYLLKDEIRPNQKKVILTFGGNELTETGKSAIKQQAVAMGLEEQQIEIRQGFSFSELSAGMKETDQLRSELNRLRTELTKKDGLSDSLKQINLQGLTLVTELQSLYPQVTKCTFSESRQYTANDSAGVPVTLVVIGLKQPIAAKERDRVEEWLKARTKAKKLIVFYD